MLDHGPFGSSGAEVVKVVSRRDKVAAVAARKAAVGFTDDRVARMRNTGAFRTPEKRALLATLVAEAQRQGRELPFSSSF